MLDLLDYWYCVRGHSQPTLATRDVSCKSDCNCYRGWTWIGGSQGAGCAASHNLHPRLELDCKYCSRVDGARVVQRKVICRARTHVLAVMVSLMSGCVVSQKAELVLACLADHGSKSLERSELCHSLDYA